MQLFLLFTPGKIIHVLLYEPLVECLVYWAQLFVLILPTNQTEQEEEEEEEVEEKEEEEEEVRIGCKRRNNDSP